eukprot:scaffold869_cov303-Pinguiococcus_pyrenoidosus.AAC.2
MRCFFFPRRGLVVLRPCRTIEAEWCCMSRLRDGVIRGMCASCRGRGVKRQRSLCLRIFFDQAAPLQNPTLREWRHAITPVELLKEVVIDRGGTPPRSCPSKPIHTPRSQRGPACNHALVSGLHRRECGRVRGAPARRCRTVCTNTARLARRVRELPWAPPKRQHSAVRELAQLLAVLTRKRLFDVGRVRHRAVLADEQDAVRSPGLRSCAKDPVQDTKDGEPRSVRRREDVLAAVKAFHLVPRHEFVPPHHLRHVPAPDEAGPAALCPVVAV